MIHLALMSHSLLYRSRSQDLATATSKERVATLDFADFSSPGDQTGADFGCLL